MYLHWGKVFWTISWLTFCFRLQNSTLQHYTLYRPSDLCACVKDLHRLCCSSHDSNLPAIRDKYSQHKVIFLSTNKIAMICFFLLISLLTSSSYFTCAQYKCVAKKHIPPSIPREVFQINWTKEFNDNPIIGMHMLSFDKASVSQWCKDHFLLEA